MTIIRNWSIRHDIYIMGNKSVFNPHCHWIITQYSNEYKLPTKAIEMRLVTWYFCHLCDQISNCYRP